jgi:hypothetical protein
MASAAPHAGHLAPHRHQVRTALLTFALVGAPLAWFVRLLFNYGYASHACFPGDAPLQATADRGFWPLLLGIDLFALALAFIAALIAYRSWRVARAEAQGDSGHLLEVGEGRTRFLALWGLMTSLGFAVAVAFDLVGLLVVPLCG